MATLAYVSMNYYLITSISICGSGAAHVYWNMYININIRTTNLICHLTALNIQSKPFKQYREVTQHSVVQFLIYVKNIKNTFIRCYQSVIIYLPNSSPHKSKSSSYVRFVLLVSPPSESRTTLVALGGLCLHVCACLLSACPLCVGCLPSLLGKHFQSELRCDRGLPFSPVTFNSLTKNMQQISS